MLTLEQRRHFTDHGWVLLEGVLTSEQCQAYIDAIDRMARTTKSLGLFQDGPDLRSFDNLHLCDPIFLEWFKLPGIMAANRQLMGADLRLQSTIAHIKSPHPDRHTRERELRNPDTWGWHRGLRPKWLVVPDDQDPSLINVAFTNNITYLTDVEPGNGSTAILDGSHRLDGDYNSLKGQCPVIAEPAKAGSVLLFTEALIHSGVPILSEKTRYNFYYEFVVPWFTSHPGYETPESFSTLVADDTVRRILSRPLYRGDTPVI
jgi:hypothetical protein